MLESIGYPGWALSALIVVPLLGMVAVLAADDARARHIALGVTVLEFVLSLPLWFAFNSASGAMQFTANVPWIPSWGIWYRVGVDGISVLLVLLLTMLMPLAVLGSYRYITRRERAFYASMLLLETGVLGAFVAMDLFLFFVFFELLLDRKSVV